MNHVLVSLASPFYIYIYIHIYIFYLLNDIYIYIYRERERERERESRKNNIRRCNLLCSSILAFSPRCRCRTLALNGVQFEVHHIFSHRYVLSILVSFSVMICRRKRVNL